MLDLLEKLNSLVWGVPALVSIIGVGAYLTVRTGFIQFRLLPRALVAFFGQFRRNGREDGTSPFRALCTALAATVGTGNLAGVAGAIALGGPGSIFWMWVCGFLGMVTKFAEAVLSVRYRIQDEKGELVGGPMYIIDRGLGKKAHLLAVFYCFFGVVASFGVGNATQINAVIGGMHGAINALGGEPTKFLDITIGIILAVVVVFVLFGGAGRIGRIAEQLVPFASVLYLLLGIVVIIGRIHYLPNAIGVIFKGAFSPEAVTGGVVGSVISVLRIGAARGVFTNEAGMGTAAIAHSAARVSHPVEQGLMGIVEVFLDTIVICTMTALVILCSGVPICYGEDTGITLTTAAFSNVLGDWVCVPIALFLCLFAIATVLGWGLYGVRCAQYLFGPGAWRGFVLLQGVTVIAGSILGTGTVWLMSEIVNGLMAIPNLIALYFLAPELVRLCRSYMGQKSGFFLTNVT